MNPRQPLPTTMEKTIPLARQIYLLGLVLLGLTLGGCQTTTIPKNPLASIRDQTLSPRHHHLAMQILDDESRSVASSENGKSGDTRDSDGENSGANSGVTSGVTSGANSGGAYSAEYSAALHRVLWLPGYTVEVRDAAFDRLKLHELDKLKRTIRQYLPRLTAWLWLNRLCERIVDEGWIELTPALVSSWARPTGAVGREVERPERIALVRLHGEKQLIDVVFDLFLESNKVSQQGLRIRCWELLHRLDQRQRLVELLTTGTFAQDDLMLHDLRTGIVELDLVPRNREEILWLRELCKPEHASFRSLAKTAIQGNQAKAWGVLELRTIPILVSAVLHRPELLQTSRAELYRQLLAYLKGQKHYQQKSNYDNFTTSLNQRLNDFTDQLSWGDLAAMQIAVDALKVEQVVAHLFDYAERDHQDTTSEFGGVIALDEKGRFEVLEFLPRVRHHDQRYNAPQALFDVAYTSLFHFHYHVQKYRNERFAGPGFGDSNYADNTRANCLVLTFVNKDTMNVDFYRHDRVVIDLGVITRP